VGEAIPRVTASAADIAAAATAGGRSSRAAKRRPAILAVPGNGLGSAAAVVPGEKHKACLVPAWKASGFR
jgi:hypothetical protein